MMAIFNRNRRSPIYRGSGLRKRRFIKLRVCQDMSVKELLRFSYCSDYDPASLIETKSDFTVVYLALKRTATEKEVDEFVAFWYGAIWHGIVAIVGADYLHENANLSQADIEEYSAGKDITLRDLRQILGEELDVTVILSRKFWKI